VPLEVLIDSEKFINVIEKNHITSAYIPPALLDDVGKKLEVSPNNVKLNRMLVGVEPIKQRTLQRFRNFSKEIKIINAYGPTETTVCSTFFDFYTEFKTKRNTPIGKAINNYEIYILDKNLQPVPIGVSGELHIAGAGLARGYLNRPNLTKEKFIPNPFDDDPDSRLYKTGDLAKWLPDGNIEYLGRIDHQVKIRGFRIELGEIEAALLSRSAVKETVLVAIESKSGDKQLAAYIITKKRTDKNSEKNISELRSFLKEKLPDYMIPAFFVFIDAFPLTPNGKIDRKALPAPDLSLMREHKFVTPKTETEKIIAEIWKKILNVEKIGIQDNFFEMGGHSLLITQVISQAREALQINLAIYNLFDYPTIAMLARYIETVDRQPDLRQTQNIQPVSRQQNLPLSSFQEQLWFLARLYPNIPFYNECAIIKITDSVLNIAALEQSLNEIIKRHEALRTTFTIVNGQPAQNIMPPPTLNLRVFDLRKLPNQQREPEAIRLATKEVKRCFDLAGDILFRAFLARIDESQYSLYITMHHVITDGISFSIFLKELSVLYKAFSAGKPSPLQDMPIQYADFACWQQEQLSADIIETQLFYWKKILGGNLPKLQLPYDHPRPKIPTFRGAKRYLALSEKLTENLKTLAKQEGVTLFMTLLAAFKTLLYRYSGQNDIIVGTVASVRSRPEFEPLIGYLLNTLARRRLTLIMTFPLKKWRKLLLQSGVLGKRPFRK